ncbi:MAG: sel1 repeat family protein [Alphaproteobacteria bacterium]|nr:sel1 repeat family protein [Alphaproteobacteria bacterium]
MKKILGLFFCFYFISETFAHNPSSVECYVYTQLHRGNSEVAINFLKQLDGIGNLEGTTLLGMIYLEGYTQIKDARLANYYFSKAAALEFAPAIKALADSYMAGEGVELNKTIAFQLYEKAAKLGYGPAQFNAGIMLKNGEGNPVSLKQAYEMLDLAAHNPDLGEMSHDAAYYRDQVKGCLGY